MKIFCCNWNIRHWL